MQLLLPPSEGKTDSEQAGLPLALEDLPFPELTAARQRIVDALARVSSGNTKRALTTLGLSANQVGELERNQQLWTAPCAPASKVYSGVLFAALDIEGMKAAQWRRASSHVAIASSAFGLVRPDSLIPAYRCSGGTNLPRLGKVSSFWRKTLNPDLLGEGAILDLRSGTYVSFMPLSKQRTDSATVKIWQAGEGNSPRTAVTHFSKQTKGEVARCLLTQSRLPNSIDEAVECLRDNGWQAELTAISNGTDRLDITI